MTVTAAIEQSGLRVWAEPFAPRDGRAMVGYDADGRTTLVAWAGPRVHQTGEGWYRWADGDFDLNGEDAPYSFDPVVLMEVPPFNADDVVTIVDAFLKRDARV